MQNNLCAKPLNWSGPNTDLGDNEYREEAWGFTLVHVPEAADGEYVMGWADASAACPCESHHTFTTVEEGKAYFQRKADDFIAAHGQARLHVVAP